MKYNNTINKTYSQEDIERRREYYKDLGIKSISNNDYNNAIKYFNFPLLS
jgi:hypothetical protein